MNTKLNGKIVTVLACIVTGLCTLLAMFIVQVSRPDSNMEVFGMIRNNQERITVNEKITDSLNKRLDKIDQKLDELLRR